MNLPRLDAPIVLAHGMFGFNRIGLGPVTLASYFRGLPELLRRAGNRVILTRVHPTAGVRRRARKLGERIDAVLPDGPFHLIGHSMGGLDGRALLAEPPWSRRVLSLTTVGTPHLGSPLAEAARTRLGPVYRALELIRWDHEGFRDVLPEMACGFHRSCPAPDDIPCFSVAGEPSMADVCRPLRLSFAWLEREAGPNDGLVPAESATAFGTPLPSWPLDHLRQMNWFAPRWADPPAWALYASVLNHLAELGFGEPVGELRWTRPEPAGAALS